MSLNHQDVQALLQLLDDSPYNELTLQTGSFTLNLLRASDGRGWQQSSSVAPRPRDQTPVASAAPLPEPPATEAGLLDVRAPMTGTWYRAPTPGAKPFIQVGSTVGENSVIGIIEAMKLMTSVPAGLQGAVAEILAPDATLVDVGQLLLRVRPQ